MAASSGRKGRRWRRIRAEVLAGSTLCHLCGHLGSGDVDHDPPREQLIADGLDPENPIYLKPAHGALSRCAECGLCCNQAKGTKRHMRRTRTSREW
jgi:hypothetical protein